MASVSSSSSSLAPNPLAGPSQALLPPVVDDVCATGPQPRLLTNALLYLLRQQFSDPAGIEQPLLRQLRWIGDPTNPAATDPSSPLVIETRGRWNPQLANNRPALVVARSDWTLMPSPRGVGDRKMGEFDFGDGSVHYENYWVGSHVVRCLSIEEDAAELLSTEVWEQLNGFADRLRVSLGLNGLRISTLGMPQALPEAANTVAVPVVVVYTFAKNWSIRQQAPRIKRIDTQMRLAP